MNSARPIKDEASAPGTGAPIVTPDALPAKRTTVPAEMPASPLAGERSTQIVIPAMTMTSREIADLAGKRHDHVLRDIEKMLCDIGATAPSFGGSYKDSTGRTLPCYTLPKRETLILVSGYSVTMRAKIIDRWQELEAAAAAPAPALLPDFTDPVAAARAWADQVEAKNLLQIENGHKDAQLAIAAPKVEFADAMINSDGTVLLRDAAKTIGAPVGKLKVALHLKGVMLTNGVPAARFVTKGYFKVSTFTVPTKRGEVMSHTTRVTGIGLEFLRRLAIKNGLIGPVVVGMDQGALL